MKITSANALGFALWLEFLWAAWHFAWHRKNRHGERRMGSSILLTFYLLLLLILGLGVFSSLVGQGWGNYTINSVAFSCAILLGKLFYTPGQFQDAARIFGLQALTATIVFAVSLF